MNVLKQKFRRAAACAALALATLPASAAGAIYDNGAPDHQSGNNMGFAWQADDFTLVDDKIHVRYCNQAAEVDRDVFNCQRRLDFRRQAIHHGASCSLGFVGPGSRGSSPTPNHFSIAGTMPCGKRKTIRIMNRP